jgi:hypothetical protein
MNTILKYHSHHSKYITTQHSLHNFNIDFLDSLAQRNDASNNISVYRYCHGSRRTDVPYSHDLLSLLRLRIIGRCVSTALCPWSSLTRPKIAHVRLSTR